MVNAKSNIAIITRLFVDYGVADEKRCRSYCEEFKGMDTDFLAAAVKKVTQKCKFFPTKADIYEELKSLNQTVTGQRICKDWDEAWQEIYNAMAQVGPYRTPQWSTAEIKKVVDSIGWLTICEVEDRNLNTLRAQMREMYNGICQRKKENNENQQVLLGVTEFLSIDKNAYEARQAIIARSKAKYLAQRGLN